MSIPQTGQREEIRDDAAHEEISEKLYSFAELDRYTVQQLLISLFAGVALYCIIRAIGATLRFEVKGWEHHTDREPLVYCFWHNRIPIATYFWRHRGIVVMSSRSFDSEYIARFIQRFGYGTAKGSSTRGARSGLIQMIRAVRSGKSAAFTVDGPRGLFTKRSPARCCWRRRPARRSCLSRSLSTAAGVCRAGIGSRFPSPSRRPTSSSASGFM